MFEPTAEYTKQAIALAKEADATLNMLRELLIAHGDTVRANDVDEARIYLEGAVSL